MKFTVVTPVYNGEKFIRETIESVFAQKGNLEIEYIIQDGGSTDGTVAIVQSLEKEAPEGVTLRWFSEKDAGMYDAIRKGFDRATGEIYAWLNADDVYVPGALESVAQTFSAFKKIEWLTGSNALILESGGIVKTNPCYIYNRNWIERGIYGKYAYFIHQESVFWRKSLWEKAGGIDTRFRLAGDYHLWRAFAKHAPLWSLDVLVGCFRRRADQLSGDSQAYGKERDLGSAGRSMLESVVRLFFYLEARSPLSLKGIFGPVYTILFPRRNKYFITLDQNKSPSIRKARSFIA